MQLVQACSFQIVYKKVFLYISEMDPGSIVWVSLGHSYGRWPAMVSEHKQRPTFGKGAGYF